MHLEKLEELKRTWTVTKEEEERIVSLRKTHISLGKQKLKRIYQATYGCPISTWKIERVVRRHNLYPDKAKRKRYFAKNRVISDKIRIHHFKEKNKERMKQVGFLWHIDTVLIWWYGTRRYIFTAIEEQTRIAFARVYTSNTSFSGEDFLKRLAYIADGKIEILHSDNGSEFQGAFGKVCQKLHITQVYSRPHTPKDNAKLEKFNDTIQREWLDNSVIGLDTIEQANEDLTEWLITYNNVRPHAALNYQTPLEFAQSHNPSLLPMTSAQTQS